MFSSESRFECTLCAATQPASDRAFTLAAFVLADRRDAAAALFPVGHPTFARRVFSGTRETSSQHTSRGWGCPGRLYVIITQNVENIETEIFKHRFDTLNVDRDVSKIPSVIVQEPTSAPYLSESTLDNQF